MDKYATLFPACARPEADFYMDAVPCAYQLPNDQDDREVVIVTDLRRDTTYFGIGGRWWMSASSEIDSSVFGHNVSSPIATKFLKEAGC